MPENLAGYDSKMRRQAPLPPPLSGDPAREAVHSLRGYMYQIWRTVEAWVQLKQDEALYVECAEDFDVVGAGCGFGVQIKNTAKPISLGSADARAAIVNYWKLRKRNPNVPRLHFRYLTRGAVTQERGKHFRGASGIDTWRAAATGEESAIELVRDYLSTQLASEVELFQFLFSNSPEDLMYELFAV